MIAVVKYQLATYSGTIRISCKENDEDKFIIAKAKKILRWRTGGFPLGSESWKIIKRY